MSAQIPREFVLRSQAFDERTGFCLRVGGGGGGIPLDYLYILLWFRASLIWKRVHILLKKFGIKKVWRVSQLIFGPKKFFLNFFRKFCCPSQQNCADFRMENWLNTGYVVTTVFLIYWPFYTNYSHTYFVWSDSIGYREMPFLL